MKVVNLTEACIRELPFNSGVWRDEQAKGLLVVCHRATKTFAAQGDVRRDGRFIRTVRMKIDRCDRIGLREARRRAKELMSKIQSGVDPSAGPETQATTLGQTLESYIKARNLSERTIENYEYHLTKYLKKWRNRAVIDISRSEVRDLFDDLKQKSGDTTASSVMRTLRALINEAKMQDQAIIDNPVSAVRLSQPRRREVADLNLPEWWQNIQRLTPLRRDMHVFLLFSGLRRMSAVSIRREDVNLKEGIARVRHMKSGKPFLLPLSDFLITLLEKRMQEDEPIGSPWLWPSATSESGHMEEPREEGFPSPHSYRHLMRTHAIAAGVPYAESALLLDQRLPGASGGYIHAEHLVDHLRRYQQLVTDRLLSLITKQKVETQQSEVSDEGGF